MYAEIMQRLVLEYFESVINEKDAQDLYLDVEKLIISPASEVDDWKNLILEYGIDEENILDIEGFIEEVKSEFDSFETDEEE